MEEIKRLEEKYNKMVEISKENLIKYEDLRIDNQKLIMEIEGLKSQIDFEAQKQTVLLQENEQLKKQIEYDSRYNDMQAEIDCGERIITQYKHALEEIKKLTVIGINASQCNCGLRALADDILQIISEVENER